jgi:alpha-glucosidase (family GH31 glycosyl hydrolase)
MNRMSLKSLWQKVRRGSMVLGFLAISPASRAAPLRIEGHELELAVRAAGDHGIRLTLKPPGQATAFPENPALVERKYPDAVIAVREIGHQPQKAKAGKLSVEVSANPLTVSISRPDGSIVQKLTFDEKGGIRFLLDDQPVLGLGEGGPRPAKGKDWRKQPVEFDRRGRLFRMEPHWQADAYGSRNPVPLLVGTGGWGLYFATPWGQIDLSKPDQGHFIPVERKDPVKMRQNHGNQTQQLGKGIPPMESFVAGFRDVFVFDARDPAAFMKDLATISGAAALPPKWALGYMQSHRTLEDDRQMVGIVDTFREKRIPVDAMIYLGTGFTPRGWNKEQPSFDFNPEVFKREPAQVIDALHERNVKVVLHMVPWDRDRLPLPDNSRLGSYWKEHENLVKLGVDGWWPDEGDWFDLYERMKRHELYYQGPISTQPDRRPWSLHRNGHLGVARWGGWIWSGDTDSTWKTLEAQVAVGINHSLSLSPYWGSDIGGFFPTPELTGELYTRWFQFGAFCPSFRSHGRTWWTRLPWGWGLNSLGPVEHPQSPDKSALNDPAIEKITRRYAELRYRLLSYNYTLAWEARETGLPMMRALWLQYPQDRTGRGVGDQYLWGRDLLIAPVYEKGAESREVYLPEGAWYDYWSGEIHKGGRKISRAVDLATMPIYVRAGAVIPIDPLRQYTGEAVTEPLTIQIYRGADGKFALYQDDGLSQDYLKGEAAVTDFNWDDHSKILRLSARNRGLPGKREPTRFRIELVPGTESRSVAWSGEPMEIGF